MVLRTIMVNFYYINKRQTWGIVLPMKIIRIMGICIAMMFVSFFMVACGSVIVIPPDEPPVQPDPTQFTVSWNDNYDINFTVTRTGGVAVQNWELVNNGTGIYPTWDEVEGYRINVMVNGLPVSQGGSAWTVTTNVTFDISMTDLSGEEFYISMSVPTTGVTLTLRDIEGYIEHGDSRLSGTSITITMQSHPNHTAEIRNNNVLLGETTPDNLVWSDVLVLTGHWNITVDIEDHGNDGDVIVTPPDAYQVVTINNQNPDEIELSVFDADGYEIISGEQVPTASRVEVVWTVEPGWKFNMTVNGITASTTQGLSGIENVQVGTGPINIVAIAIEEEPEEPEEVQGYEVIWSGAVGSGMSVSIGSGPATGLPIQSGDSVPEHTMLLIQWNGDFLGRLYINDEPILLDFTIGVNNHYVVGPVNIRIVGI